MTEISSGSENWRASLNLAVNGSYLSPFSQGVLKSGISNMIAVPNFFIIFCCAYRCFECM